MTKAPTDWSSPAMRGRIAKRYRSEAIFRFMGLVALVLAGTFLVFLLYTIVLVAVAVAPWPLGYFSAIYGVASLGLGAGMMLCAVNVYNRRTGSAALRATRKMFAFSILYLFALFAILLLEVVVKAILPLVW